MKLKLSDRTLGKIYLVSGTLGFLLMLGAWFRVPSMSFDTGDVLFFVICCWIIFRGFRLIKRNK